jgi:hypothetical protein
MRHPLTALVITATLAATCAWGAGCSSKPEATCDNVGAHLKQILLNTDEVKKAAPDQQKNIGLIVESMGVAVAKDCKEKKWDAKTIDCMMAAKKSDDAEKCELKK